MGTRLTFSQAVLKIGVAPPLAVEVDAVADEKGPAETRGDGAGLAYHDPAEQQAATAPQPALRLTGTLEQERKTRPTALHAPFGMHSHVISQRQPTDGFARGERLKGSKSTQTASCFHCACANFIILHLSPPCLYCAWL